ncbi:MAG: cyclohexanone monooxygenase, partial [Janthinobacterium lividum]
PAHNRPADPERFDRLAVRLDATWSEVLRAPAGNLFPPNAGPAGTYSAEEQQKLLEQRWAFGGQPMLSTFSDQGVEAGVNAVVSEFVRSKIRQKVVDPAVAAKLVPDAYPIGVRRLCVDTGYYETFNRDNVTLISIRDEPIQHLTPTGIQTRDRHVDLDVVIFAIGFEAFTGALDGADIRNEHDRRPQDGWSRGPRTYYGIMAAGFPNLFLVTGPGSPSVLANMNAANVQHLDFVGELIAHADARGSRRVEPTDAAVDAWTAQTAAVAENLIRRQIDNYMVHVNHDDGSRVFIPYAGGFGDYVARVNDEVRAGYPGLCFS